MCDCPKHQDDAATCSCVCDHDDIGTLGFVAVWALTYFDGNPMGAPTSYGPLFVLADNENTAWATAATAPTPAGWPENDELIEWHARMATAEEAATLTLGTKRERGDRLSELRGIINDTLANPVNKLVLERDPDAWAVGLAMAIHEGAA